VKKLICILVFWVLVQSILGQDIQLTNLPTLYITIQDNKPVVSKELYLPAKITVKSKNEGQVLTDMVTEIRGRGNSTWNMPKKPFRLKLEQKMNFLGLPAKERSWVLLANYADKTLIRNAVAFKISEMVGLEFTPSALFVDLFLNGKYLGNYMVTDQVEVGKARVSVEKQEPDETVEPAITGGYLLEIDGFAASESVWFSTGKGLKVSVKHPNDDEVNSQQLDYITKYINDFEKVLFSSAYKDPVSGYRAWVDTASLVNWYIASELTGNPDAFWSTYIYKRRNNPKLFFGPMWDYDIAFNNDDRLGDATMKLMRTSAHNPRTWIEQMWKDEWFQKAVERRWLELRNGLYATLEAYIDKTTSDIHSSQQLNFASWIVLNKKVYRETFLFQTYYQGVDYLKEYLEARINFLDESFVSQEPEKPSVPFVADNFYYSIMNRKSNNVIEVSGEVANPGSLLSLWEPKEGVDKQLWKIETLGAGLFRFVNKQTGMAMAGNGKGKNLKQVPLSLTDKTQLWEIIPVLSGNIYGIVNHSSGYSANNSGGSLNNGNPVIEYDNNIYSAEKTNQHWYIQKAEKIDNGQSKPENLLAYGQSATIFQEPHTQNVIVLTKMKQTICLYNMGGHLLRKIEVPDNSKIQIDLSTLPSGIYLIKSENAAVRVLNTR
jgi:hypothetical protein